MKVTRSERRASRGTATRGKAKCEQHARQRSEKAMRDNAEKYAP